MRTLCSAKVRLVAVTAILTLAALPPSQAADVLVNSDVPVSEVSSTVVNPCNGETVLITGSYHVQEILQTTPNGPVLRLHVNAQDIKGVGLTTGATYNVVDMQNYAYPYPNGSDISLVANIRFMARGGAAPSYIFHHVFHINPNTGEVTVDNGTTECR